MPSVVLPQLLKSFLVPSNSPIPTNLTCCPPDEIAESPKIIIFPTNLVPSTLNGTFHPMAFLITVIFPLIPNALPSNLPPCFLQHWLITDFAALPMRHNAFILIPIECW